MSLEVKYIDVPDGAQAAAQAQSESSQSFCTDSQVMTGAQGTAWASLEPGSWSLDGSRQIMEDEPQNMGWWSICRSGEDGYFTEPPVITVTFPKVYTATGLTFTFWPQMEQWCSKIRVVWYNAQTLLWDMTVSPNSPRWTLSQTVEGFDRVDVYLLATNIPKQFAKLQLLRIGQEVLFGKEELVKLQLLNEVDPALCQLSVDTMKLEIRDRQGQNLAPQKNQRMELYRNGELLAVQYIKTASREAAEQYVFSCQSVIGLLEETYLGGMYQQMPLQTLLQEVLGQYPFSMETQFADKTVTGYLGVQSRRLALQQIAFAVGAAVTSQRDGTIKLSALPEHVTAVFSASQIFPGTKVSRTAQVEKVEVYAHGYVPVDEEETLLDQEAVNGENVLFVFSQPHHGYAITGGSITESNANWVKITADGEVTLTGKKYNHTTSVFTKRNPLVTAVERGNVVTVEDAALVHKENVQQVLGRLYRAQIWNHTLTQDGVLTGFQAGQKVSSVNPWGTATEGYITAMDSTFTQNGQTGEVTIRGVEVELRNVYYHAGDLYANDMEVPY